MEPRQPFKWACLQISSVKLLMACPRTFFRQDGLTGWFSMMLSMIFYSVVASCVYWHQGSQMRLRFTESLPPGPGPWLQRFLLNWLILQSDQSYITLTKWHLYSRLACWFFSFLRQRRISMQAVAASISVQEQSVMMLFEAQKSELLSVAKEIAA